MNCLEIENTIFKNNKRNYKLCNFIETENFNNLSCKDKALLLTLKDLYDTENTILSLLLGGTK